VTRVFFRQIEVVGLENVPATGPVIFAGNHPNSLIDPILIITTCGRKVHFAAKDTLFKGRLMRAVLGALGAVPIKRRDDHAGATDNDAAFASMFGVLQEGGTIGIFPEGLSHDEAHLAKLKTGAARLALGAKVPVTVVPCGLTFIHPKRFRSRVLVQYGAPIEAKGDAREVTAAIQTGLERLTINAPDWDTVRALDVVRRLYQPQEISIEERVELARRFNAYYGQVAADPRVVDLMHEVRAYQRKLDELGLSDRELARDLSKLEVVARVVRHFMLMVFVLPLTVPGAPLHVPPLIFARYASRRLTPRKDVLGTTKLMIGMLITLFAYAIAIAVVWWKAGFAWAALAMIVLPVSGWATLRVLDRVRLVRRGLGVLFRRLRFRRAVHALRDERVRLAARTIDVVTAVKPAQLPPLFPPDHPDRLEESWRARRNADLDSEMDRE
jgi:1-acyl-sn-glycerol-3-phosphate acyltransferase